jgi:hypothetical protein
MNHNLAQYRLLMEELDSGYLMILIGDEEEVDVRPEDCLGQLNEPMFHGENASFDLTQEQFETIRCRALARQVKEGAPAASGRAQAEPGQVGQPTPHSWVGDLLGSTAVMAIPVVIGALTVYFLWLIQHA